MSFGKDTMKIGKVINGKTFEMSNIDLASGTYTLTEDMGDEFGVEEGTETMRALIKAEPQSVFVAL